MTDLSIIHTARPTAIDARPAERFMALLHGIVCRVTADPCLGADLIELPDDLLQDIGLLRDDVATLRKAPDGPARLARRIRERHARRQFPCRT